MMMILEYVLLLLLLLISEPLLVQLVYLLFVGAVFIIIGAVDV